MSGRGNPKLGKSAKSLILAGHFPKPSSTFTGIRSTCVSLKIHKILLLSYQRLPVFHDETSSSTRLRWGEAERGEEQACAAYMEIICHPEGAEYLGTELSVSQLWPQPSAQKPLDCPPHTGDIFLCHSWSAPSSLAHRGRHSLTPALPPVL